jgi:hypothetical protein
VKKFTISINFTAPTLQHAQELEDLVTDWTDDDIPEGVDDVAITLMEYLDAPQ